VGLWWPDVDYVLELDMPIRSWAVIPFILEYVHVFQVSIVFCDANEPDVLVINGISIITCANMVMWLIDLIILYMNLSENNPHHVIHSIIHWNIM
jgi:hypothetical protein